MLRLIIALTILCTTAVAQAELKFYGEARVGAGGVRHSDVDFYPTFGSFSAGVFFLENIGIEGFIDTELSDDNSGVFDLGISQASGAALRFQSKPNRGLHAYLLLGYVNFSLEQRERGFLGIRTVKETFGGARVSIGVNQRLKVIDGLIFGAEYRNYFSDSGVTVDGFSLGLRYEMP